MLVVKNIRVWTLSRDSLTISWDIADTPEDLSTFTITIMRSGSEDGPYTAVGTPFGADTAYEYEDSTVILLSKWREYFYRIRVTDGGGDYLEYGSAPVEDVVKGESPGGVTLEALPDLEGAESARRFELTAREYIGRKVLHLAQRSWGQYCTNCWDVLKSRSTLSNCTTCYGSRRTGGYYTPQATYAVKPPNDVVVALTPLFEMQPRDVIMWFPNKPRLRPRDLVVDIDGTRWRVERISRAEKLWALTRQTVQIRAISRDQIEYSIPVTWDMDSFRASPLRQYANCTDIDSYYKTIRDLGRTEDEG